MRCSKGVAVACVFQVLLSGCFLCLSNSLVREEVWGIDLPEDAFRVFQSVIFGCIALGGVITAIGVWRLREWGRTSSLWLSCAVFLGYLPNIAWYAYVVRTSPDVGGSWEIMYPLAPLFAVGIWWLILFTRPKVKDQFLRQSKAVAAMN